MIGFRIAAILTIQWGGMAPVTAVELDIVNVKIVLEADGEGGVVVSDGSDFVRMGDRVISVTARPTSWVCKQTSLAEKRSTKSSFFGLKKKTIITISHAECAVLASAENLTFQAGKLVPGTGLVNRTIGAATQPEVNTDVCKAVCPVAGAEVKADPDKPFVRQVKGTPVGVVEVTVHRPVQ